MRRRDDDELAAVQKWLDEHEREYMYRHQYYRHKFEYERLIESYERDAERAEVLAELRRNRRSIDDLDSPWEYDDDELQLEDCDDGDEFD